MGWKDWFTGPQAKDGSPIANWWHNVSSDKKIMGIPNIFHGADDYFSGMNDAPTPGFDSQGNYIGQTPVGYENPNRLTDAYQAKINTYQGDAFSPTGLGPMDQMIADMMKGTPGYSGKAEGAAAASAYNPVFANLAAEKLAAKTRGKKNQQDIKGAYKALASDYVNQAAAEVKGHAKATKEQNKAFAKDTFETGDAYTKVKAESDAEAARLGQTGTSAQQMADQKIGLASAQAVDLQKYQQNMNKAASDQISKAQSGYMTRGSMIAPQAGAEQVNQSKMKLEDVLLGLNKEEAQAKLQQAAARMSAQNAAHRDASGPSISDFIGLTKLKMDLTDWENKDGSIDPSKLKGLNDAYKFGIVSDVPAAQMDAFMKSFQSDADINSGMYQDPMLKKQVKMTKEMKLAKIYSLAVQAGIGTVKARQMAEIYLRGV